MASRGNEVGNANRTARARERAKNAGSALFGTNSAQGLCARPSPGNPETYQKTWLGSDRNFHRLGCAGTENWSAPSGGHNQGKLSQSFWQQSAEPAENEKPQVRNGDSPPGSGLLTDSDSRSPRARNLMQSRYEVAQRSDRPDRPRRRQGEAPPRTAITAPRPFLHRKAPAPAPAQCCAPDSPRCL
ncbi:hypothetical protein Thiowin_00430 [Thiorhodovibrio winogradskyi]|uniref:Uncharacterized protein n=1 Tax=Thiorhodovibrio winogradskyi TaxID=77007 RepID=A0ABZ0S2U4_9GAMM